MQYSNFLQFRGQRGTGLQNKSRSDTISHKPIFSLDFIEKIDEEDVNPEEKTMGKDEFNVFLKIYFELVLDIFRNQKRTLV